MPFDAAAQPQRLTPGHRPGERMLHGAPYVFNSTTLNAHLADIAIEDAPADLTGLSYQELCALVFAYLNRSQRVFDAETKDFGTRVCSERAKRPEYIAVYGRAA